MYVADKYAAGKLAPAVDDPTRGQYYYWMVFTPGVAEPAMAEKFSGAKPNKQQNGWGDFDSMIETLEKGLGDRDWIMGDAFSAADVMCGSSACFMKQFGILPSSKILEAYAERCMARPAYKRSIEINEAG